MNPTETSAHIRTKESAKDERPSAQSAGYMAIGLLSVITVVIVLPDVIASALWIMGRL